MVYFCADDYGLTKESSGRIEKCIKDGVLNKISVLPNGEITDFKERLKDYNTDISLHINLVEGYSLTKAEDIKLLVTESGCFKHSFIGLLRLSYSAKRKEFEKQIYLEIKNQIEFWKKQMGENTAFLIDSHQHTHMIPLIFKTLMQVIKDEGINVKYLRVPTEPISPYLRVPSLYLTYSPVNLVKQLLLNFLAFVNNKEIKKGKIDKAYVMGVLFSGKMDEKRVKKVLPEYIKLAEKNKKDIELIFHPGYLKNGEKMMKGARCDFEKFYLSPGRNVEFDTLINFKF